MMYMGGKQRISKELSIFIYENYLEGNNKPFVDLMCGSCNILTNINKLQLERESNNRLVIGNDKHKYLIAMWKELQNGWIPPKNCSKEQYKYIKEHINTKPYVSGFIGFGCSYAGRWFNTYAKDSNGRNYCLNAHNSTMKKLNYLMNVQFYCKDYAELEIPSNSIVYIDKPYENTTPYSIKEVGVFDHNKFWQWVRNNSYKYTILVSEYFQNIPKDFKIVWEKESKQDVRNKYNKKNKTIEVLVTYKNS